MAGCLIVLELRECNNSQERECNNKKGVRTALSCLEDERKTLKIYSNWYWRDSLEGFWGAKALKKPLLASIYVLFPKTIHINPVPGTSQHSGQQGTRNNT